MFILKNRLYWDQSFNQSNQTSDDLLVVTYIEPRSGNSLVGDWESMSFLINLNTNFLHFIYSLQNN
jgi:hypothetical protein